MWDATVIGSGIGGLAAAALGKRGRWCVLPLEQHSVAGGQTQIFRRQAWEFATGVHYYRRRGPAAGLRRTVWPPARVASEGGLRFAPCANPYDIIHLPGFAFGIPHPEAAYREALPQRFADEIVAIDRWFRACHEAREAAFTLFAQHGVPRLLAAGLRLLRGRPAEAWARRTVADELAQVTHPQPRAVLGARWGDYGAPPATAPMVKHARVTGAYDAGVYYPIGGPARFAQALLPAVLAGRR